ncbi:MAG TPA: hypothetical protein VL463_34475 [Kofleriaceae bacterium]|nr:hypothetical protein [Kofleriaceae bacterium]
MRGLVLVALLVPSAALAQGDDGDNPGLITPTKKPPSEAVHQGHDGQFGLGLQLAVGMRAINPYDNEYCGAVGDNGNANQAYCLARVPMTLDFELTYGVKPAIEAMLEVRIGVERDFGASSADMTGPRVHQFAPGARFYFSESGRSKFFSTAQIVLDTSGYSGVDGTDFMLRNVNGFMFDIQKSYGVYVFFGEEVGFKRWLSATLEGGIGIQGRYP